MPQRHTIGELPPQSTARLADRFQDVPADRIREYQQTEANRLGDRPIQAFVPILAERAVRNRIQSSILDSS